MAKKLLIVQCAALSEPPQVSGLTFRRTDGVFPAVTCTAQASFRTASPPADHGMIANGLFFRPLRRAMFWEQSAGLVAGRRIWDRMRAVGGRVGMMFWQQSLGEAVDLVLSPAPIHKHHGGMIEACYARPRGLYDRLRRRVGRAFRLRHYWGPLASPKAGDWIADATAAVLADAELAPELLLTYLPTLDYDLQRHGPGSPRAAPARQALGRQLVRLLDAARAGGYEVLVFGDYAIGRAERAGFPNRVLAAAGLLETREVAGMRYPDLWASRAFAMVDHEVAHVYVRDAADVPAARDVLAGLDTVADVLDRDGQRDLRIDHPNSGELVLVAAEGAWLAYPWWTDPARAPDYAAHVDIHNKPGFDPCELRMALWPPLSVSQDPRAVAGTHGRTGPGRRVAWACTCALPQDAGDLAELGESVRRVLDEWWLK